MILKEENSKWKKARKKRKKNQHMICTQKTYRNNILKCTCMNFCQMIFMAENDLTGIWGDKKQNK